MPTTVEEIEEETDDLLKTRPAHPLGHIQALHLNPKTREMFVVGEITEDFSDWFITSLRYLNSLNSDPITIWLSTEGGSVEGALVFHDLVRLSGSPITVIGTGSVASAGVLMLACGHKRYVTESCVLMSHEGSIDWQEGKYSELKDRRKYEDWIMSNWYELMGRYAKDPAHWKSITSRKAEYWLLGGKAIVEEGLADAILTPEILNNIRNGGAK